MTAIRCSIGLATPLLGFWVSGHLAYGVLAGIGAIYSGLASFNGVYQTRLKYMAAVTFLMVVVSILGTVVSSHVWLSIASVTVCGFLLSLYSALRPATNLLSSLATATLIILSKVLKVHGDLSTIAVGNGLLILAGGASQIAMLTLFWPFTQHVPERNAIATVYESLSDFATKLGRGEAPPMLEGESILRARDLMDGLDRYKMKPEQIALREALSAAEGIRASLVGLTDIPNDDRPRIAAYLFFISARLDEVADQIRHKQILEIRPNPEVHLPQGITEETHASLSVIYALLQSALTPTSLPSSPRKTISDWTHHLSFRLMALESSHSLRIIALRHAVRYSLAICGATCLSRLGHFGNGYWIPLTTCLVLRSDYASTVRIGISRAVGTALGVTLAILVSVLTKGSVQAHVAVVLVATFGFFLVYTANYMVFTALVTLWVISSISASGIPEKLIGFQRFEATLIGIVISVLAYRLLPNWQSGRVREVLSDAAEAQSDFCQEVLLQPFLPPKLTWEKALDRARALRYEAESVVDSAIREPVWKKDENVHSSKEILIDLEKNASLILGLLSQRLASQEMTHRIQVRAERIDSKARELMKQLG